jgi:hypothetical protein
MLGTTRDTMFTKIAATIRYSNKPKVLGFCITPHKKGWAAILPTLLASAQSALVIGYF